MSESSVSQRLPIGQLLVQHLRLFRAQVLAEAQERADEAGVGFRLPYMHVFANITAGGTRLTELATLAGMTRPAMAELVDDLEAQGLVERRADPTDRRAKLVTLTTRGQEVVAIGRTIIARVERDYARRVGPRRYEAMCHTMQQLLDDLNAAPDASTPDEPQR